jgi:hypothetical protein
MKQGTVYLHLGYQFPSGVVHNKFFIILNTPRPTEFFIPCITTTQQRSRSDREGCHNTGKHYVLRENFDFFPEKTWVVFGPGDYYPMSQEQLFNYVKRGIISKKAELRQETTRAIINCIGRSEDISGYYWSMINR